MAAYKYLSNEDFERVLCDAIVVSFRYNVICGKNPNDIEKVFNDIAIKISNENQYYNLSKRGQINIESMIKMNYKGEEYPYKDKVTYYLDTNNNEDVLKQLLISIYNKKKGDC
jgi:hypothetical protein